MPISKEAELTVRLAQQIQERLKEGIISSILIRPLLEEILNEEFDGRSVGILSAEFEIVVDYTRPLYEVITGACFEERSPFYEERAWPDWVNHDGSPLEIPSATKVEKKVFLFNLGRLFARRKMPRERILAILRELKLTPATVWELMTFAYEHPRADLGSTITEIGSISRRISGGGMAERHQRVQLLNGARRHRLDATDICLSISSDEKILVVAEAE